MNSLRRDKILRFIEENSAATVAQLRELFPDISVMTIHRDLEFLSKKGAINRVRGGARAVANASEPSFGERVTENSSLKIFMAKKALELIKPKTCIYLDAGTSCLALAKLLPDIEADIYTIAPNIAIELLHLKKPAIHICGGNLNRANLALSGQITLNSLNDMHIDIAFIGSGGFSFEKGFTCGKESEALTKALVMKNAGKTAALTDSSKFGRSLPFYFADYSNFDYFVSDGELQKDFFQKAAEYSVKII